MKTKIHLFITAIMALQLITAIGWMTVLIAAKILNFEGYYVHTLGSIVRVSGLNIS